MTTAFSIGASGDLERVNGRFVRVDSLVQRISHRLRLIQREWFLDRNAGVPYLDRILGKKINVGHLRQILRAQIRSVEGVRQLNDLRLEFDAPTRHLLVRFRVNGGEEVTISAGVPR